MSQLALAISMTGFCLALYAPAYIHNFLIRKSKLHGFEETFNNLVSEVKQDYPLGQLHRNPFILAELYKKARESNIKTT